jgi:predicted phage tail protein
MKVNFLGDNEPLELNANCIKEVLSLLKLLKGNDYINNLLNNEHYFILMDSNNPESAVALNPEVIFSEFDSFDTLFIVPNLEGDIGAVVAGAILGAAAAGTAAFVAITIIVDVIVAIAISMALNLIMQALSPTPEFSKDPSQAQQNVSNLFNGAPVIREQGGSVPLVFGNPYCGGVLISSGIFSEES